MPQTCTVCSRPDRAAVDAALLNRTPIRIVADRFDLSLGAVNRHKAKCLVGVIQAAGITVPDPRSAAIQASNSGLVEQVRTQLRVLEDAAAIVVEIQSGVLDELRRTRKAYEDDPKGDEHRKRLVGIEHRLLHAVEVLVKVKGGGVAQFAELGGKASGELQSGTTVNVAVLMKSPEMAQVQADWIASLDAGLAGLPDAAYRKGLVGAEMRRRTQARQGCV